jgi:quinol monooxygenase YgiN
MRSFAWSITLIVLLLCAAPTQAAFDPSAPIYVVSYIDVLATAHKPAAKLLKKYRDASRQEPGALGVELLAQSGRPSGFAVIESWRDNAAWDAHHNAMSTIQVKQDLKAMELGPWDVHTHSDLVGGSAIVNMPNALIVMVHLDVIPPFTADLMKRLQRYVEESRDASGLLRHIVIQGSPPRINHFTVIEDWRDERALEAHQSSAAAQAYRDWVAPALGASYDERNYRILN